jgi:predicted phosphodiesterase
MLMTDTHFGLSTNTHRILAEFYKKAAKENVDAIVHTGDWITHSCQDKLERAFKQIRKFIPKVPIYTAFGNHDYWGPKNRRHLHNREAWGQIEYDRKHLCMEWDINWLTPRGVFLEGTTDVLMCGFDGWYRHTNPPTNDECWMTRYISECPAHVFMNHRASKQVEELVRTSRSFEGKVIVATHFNSYDGDEQFMANQRYFPELTESCDVLCMGHVHRSLATIRNGCLVLNAGSDYDDPKYLIFELKV